MRSLVLLLAVGCCCLLAASAATAAPAAPPIKLVGTVGPGFTITLMKGGKPFKSLPAGAYTITIRDLSNIHNFHLSGPGVNKLTSVGGKGNSNWSVGFKHGKYHFQCDPHASSMKGNFTVQ